MDTTIWEIRPSTVGDSEEQILLSINALASAVSQDVVRCRADNILHITDLHFALAKFRHQHIWCLESEDATRHSMVEAVAAGLGNREIGLVIASGYFTFIGSQEEFNEATSALSHLLGILDLSPDHLVIVPGNHDIQWSTAETYKNDSPGTQAPLTARRNYEEFYRRMMRHEPNRHLAMGRRYVLPSGLVLEICALNSSSLATGRNFLAGMGRIDEASFAEVSKEFGWSDARSLAFRLLVIHHHLAITEDLEPAQGYGLGYGIAVDAVRVQRMAATRGVHLAVHGHKHRAFLWRSSVFELPENSRIQHRLGELSIVGGGSVGSSETDRMSNYFNFLGFTARELTVDIFKSERGGTFEPIQRWSAPLSLDGDVGGLKLGDWRLAAR